MELGFNNEYASTLVEAFESAINLDLEDIH